MSVFSLADELLLAAPIVLPPDELVCDHYGCDRTADLIVPGAALCRTCAREFGILVREVYVVPVDDLVGGEEWREARRLDYCERLDALRARGARPRDEHGERLIERFRDGRSGDH